ncbi:MAG: NAD-dependent epimerase/dehydratase family protein [Brumimicrobium sp.]|nr:NAD-dependent epimerase/dehydratase family protein [Brumimicrobium sp.]
MYSPVVLTGGTGYLGSHILIELLKKEYVVHLTTRDVERTKNNEWIKRLMNENPGRLHIFPGDLMDKGSFDEAMKGAKGLIHAASPFLIDNVKDPKKELIEPAVKGTSNVLHAAEKAGTVEKVVLTSSVAAVHGDAIDIKECDEGVFSEKHWNTSSSISHQPYSYSKVTAEKEAWAINKGKSWKLVTINPGFIIGPAVVKRTDSASIKLIKGMLSGEFKTGVPDLHFVMVDVRDVARAHVLALENNTAKGRFICASEPMSMWDVAKILKQEVGGKYTRLPKRKLPHFLTYLLGPFMADLTWKYLRRNLGIPVYVDNSKIKETLGIEFRPMNETLRDHAEQLERDGLV